MFNKNNKNILNILDNIELYLKNEINSLPEPLANSTIIN